MAEPVGTTLGALGVLGLLSVCIDSFNFIEDGRSVGKGYTLLRGEFANLRFRLLVWCRACKFFDEGGYDARLNHPELRPQIFAQLNSICLLFMDAKKVIAKYDAPVASAHSSTPGSIAVFVEEGMHDFLKRIKQTKSKAGFLGAFLWALKDKRLFEELIQRLEKCISALELVTANLDLFEEPHLRFAVEIEVETLSDVEILGNMVAASDSSQSGAMISDAASQRILSLRSQPGSHERSTATSGSQTFYTAHTLHDVHVMEPIPEESVFSSLDVQKPALHEAMRLFLERHHTEYDSLFSDWFLTPGHEVIDITEDNQFPSTGMDAPTSHYKDSPSGAPKAEDSTEKRGPEANESTAPSSTEDISTLSSSLRQISMAVKETFWNLRGELRSNIEHKRCIGNTLNLLHKAYSGCPTIVQFPCKDLFGDIPELRDLHENLLVRTDTHDSFIIQIISAHWLSFGNIVTLYEIDEDQDRSSDGEETDPPVDQRAEGALSILSGYSDPEAPMRPWERNTLPEQVEDILIRILALRLAAIAHFWALIGYLESRPDHQARLQNTTKRGGNETCFQLDDQEWGRCLLEFKRQDVEKSTGFLWDWMCEEALEVAEQYPSMSLRLIRGQGDAEMQAIVTFEAPPQSPYATGIFQVHVSYPMDYPGDPMEMRFLTKIYHPNIDQTGKICLNLLEEGWDMNLNTATLVMEICALLSDPNTDDPLVPEIAATYIKDRKEYTRCAKLYTKKYATLEAAMERLAQQEAQ